MKCRANDGSPPASLEKEKWQHRQADSERPSPSLLGVPPTKGKKKKKKRGAVPDAADPVIAKSCVLGFRFPSSSLFSLFPPFSLLPLLLPQTPPRPIAQLPRPCLFFPFLSRIENQHLSKTHTHHSPCPLSPALSLTPHISTTIIATVSKKHTPTATHVHTRSQALSLHFNGLQSLCLIFICCRKSLDLFSNSLNPTSPKPHFAASNTRILTSSVSEFLDPPDKPPAYCFSLLSNMNPSRSSYVEYGAGNMLNLEVGTIKRKIDSNEYDDEALQEVQPNGKRTCSPMNGNANQFSSFGRSSAPQTPNGAPAWSQAQSNPSPLLRTAMNSSASAHGFALNTGYQTPESTQSSVAVSPMLDMDMDMESSSDAGAPYNHGAQDSPMMVQNTNAMLSAAISSPMTIQSSSLLPSALPGQQQFVNSNSNRPNMDTEAITNTAPVTEYVPIHGRSMEIPSYARVPLNEARKYRDQRWSSCIYGADTRLGQGMMI